MQLKNRSYKILYVLFVLPILCFAQADNEIQVYASPTVGKSKTIFELHNNYTFNGRKTSLDPAAARWTNHTLEITHGFGNIFEVGFYTFTAFSPDSKYQYLGNQIRPRVSVPKEWGWKVGASLSMEVGFFRPDQYSAFQMQGEIRPIIDKTMGNWYVSVNPNVEFVLTGADKEWGIAPQAKGVYTFEKKFGFGIEYYGSLGTFRKISPWKEQEHLLGPIFDLYTDPAWELQTGFLFGITPGSNQQIFKLLVGRRFGK